MRFTKIKVTEKGGVELSWVTKKEGGATESVEFSSPEKPLADLPAALAAFARFVVDLIDVPEWFGQINVTTLSINSEKDGRRGLIVTATKKIEKASGRVLVINTPLMKERGENTSDEASGIFDDSILELIATAETAATRYHKGEREQLDAFTPPAQEAGSDATGVVDGSAYASGGAPAKRGRRPKRGEFIPEVGVVQNPSSTIAPTDETLVRALAVVGRDVPIDAVSHWTSHQRDQAMEWAFSADHLPEPEHVQKAATLPLPLGDGAPADSPQT